MKKEEISSFKIGLRTKNNYTKTSEEKTQNSTKKLKLGVSL